MSITRPWTMLYPTPDTMSIYKTMDWHAEHNTWNYVDLPDLTLTFLKLQLKQCWFNRRVMNWYATLHLKQCRFTRLPCRTLHLKQRCFTRLWGAMLNTTPENNDNLPHHGRPCLVLHLQQCRLLDHGLRCLTLHHHRRRRRLNHHYHRHHRH